MEKAFDDQLMGEEKYLKTKVNFYDDKINIDFHGKKKLKRFFLRVLVSNTNLFDL